METKLQKALCQAAARIFEEICFMFEAPELEEAFKDARIEAVASVEFHGPADGSLVIRVYKGLLSAIAANMLGEEAPSKKQCSDALGEIANIICGNILPAIHGSKEVFLVDAPQIIEDENQLEDISEVEKTKEPLAKTEIVLDQGKADLLLYIHQDVALSKGE